MAKLSKTEAVEQLPDDEDDEVAYTPYEPEPEADEEDERPLRIYRVVPEKPRIRTLVYSEPGAGKTTLAASAQEHKDLSPVLFANIEGGLLSVAGRRTLHAVDIERTDQLEKLYYKLRRKEGNFAKAKTLVIDNATELQTLNLDEIVHAEVAANSKGNRISVDDVWQEDYGVSTMQLGRLFRWFKGLDMNLIITAHAKFVYPLSSNRNRQAAQVDQEPIAVLPMITQKLCKSLMGMVDFVWFLQYEPETDVRQMLTRPDGIYQAKTRGPRFQKMLGNIVTNPTMPQLYDTLVRAESGTIPRKVKTRSK